MEIGIIFQLLSEKRKSKNQLPYMLYSIVFLTDPRYRFDSLIEDNKVLSQNNVQLTQQLALLRRSVSQQHKRINEGEDTGESITQIRALMAALANDVEEMRYVVFPLHLR